MSNNEMIPATNYTALKDFNLAEAMASEMNGMDVPEIPFSKIDEIGAGMYKGETIPLAQRHKPE